MEIRQRLFIPALEYIAGFSFMVIAGGLLLLWRFFPSFSPPAVDQILLPKLATRTILMVGSYVIMNLVVLAIYRRRSFRARQQSLFTLLILLAFECCFVGKSFAIAFGIAPTESRFYAITIAIILLVSGNYLGKRNGDIGLSHPNNNFRNLAASRRAGRANGKVMVVLGVLLLAAALAAPVPWPGILAIAAFLAAILHRFYSYQRNCDILEAQGHK